MILNTTKDRLRLDPSADAFVDLIENNDDVLGLKECHVYYKFPLYKENDDVISARMIVVSRNHGVIVISPTGANNMNVESSLRQIDYELDVVFGHLHARLTKNKSLRRDKKSLLFNLDPLIFAPGVVNNNFDDITDVKIVADKNQLISFFKELEIQPLSEYIVREICAVIEGAKGLIVPKARETRNLPAQSRASQVNELEAEIASFDRDQKKGYMEVFEGPQRIRGLAGSGKTVVLAMKAALTHLRDPEATIIYTFYTRSLYQHVRRLITRFYRQYDDQDPNWDKLQVMHAWGGRGRNGVYYEACRANGVTPLSFGEVSHEQHPFDAACLDLLAKTELKPSYDYVFVDEGQDFPASFLRISLSLARGKKFVYAYDELQNIFQAEIPSVESVFGEGFRLSEDVVLKRCYRNPRETLVLAHGIGFGIYGSNIVQMLENKDHWEDLGYEVVVGELEEGQHVEIDRPAKNSPNSISNRNSMNEIVNVFCCDSTTDEIKYVSDKIVDDIKVQGLNPEDIVVLCVDDKHAKSYFSKIAAILAEHDIASNNLNADSYSGDVFTREKSVTLTSVHRAKGNEGYAVYVLGVDALFNAATIRNRNRAFTAMTRAKAWLCVTGVGPAARRFADEIASAQRDFPRLKFEYPSADQLKIMKRDLEETAQQKIERLLSDAIDDVPEEEFKKIFAKISASKRKKFSK